MPRTPRTIEGVDIAHLGGGETVASLVSFIDGLPFKPGYRRYRIRTVSGVDDFASIREVVSPSITKEEDLAWIVERLEHLAREGKSDELVRALKSAVQDHATAAEEPPAPDPHESYDSLNTRAREQENA